MTGTYSITRRIEDYQGRRGVERLMCRWPLISPQLKMQVMVTQRLNRPATALYGNMRSLIFACPANAEATNRHERESIRMRFGNTHNSAMEDAAGGVDVVGGAGLVRRRRPHRLPRCSWGGRSRFLLPWHSASWCGAGMAVLALPGQRDQAAAACAGRRSSEGQTRGGRGRCL
jgi:hypothetical protein